MISEGDVAGDEGGEGHHHHHHGDEEDEAGGHLSEGVTGRLPIGVGHP